MKLFVFATFYIASALGAPQLDIVGGQVGDITEYPYNVAVLEDGEHVCGGALISQGFVLSAAQCVASFDGEIKYKEYSIRYGSNDHMSGGAIIEVTSIIIPGLYSQSGYDIALLQLQENVTYSDKAQAVSLPDASSQISVGTKANVTGWGAKKEGSEAMVMQLQVAELEVLEQKQCSVYGASLSDEMSLCVGSQAAGKGPCKMDEGDPLVSDGKIIGVVSNSSGCGNEGYPGLYTNVAAHKEWIDYYTNSGFPPEF